VTYLVLAVLQLAVVILQGTGHGSITKTTLAASILSLISTVILLVLSDFEHCRTPRPSEILQLFWASIVILDLPRVRTTWLLDQEAGYATSAVFTTTFAFHIVLLFLASIKTWKHAAIPAESLAPEERQGIFGRLFFTWLNPMFMEGYRRDLTMDDLYAIDEGLKGTVLYQRLLDSWNSGKIALSLFEVVYELMSLTLA
jgi:ATP-binding cassette, subfamily C (CFTR/MRP), member 1